MNDHEKLLGIGQNELILASCGKERARFRQKFFFSGSTQRCLNDS
jgi:hypothetical protein